MKKILVLLAIAAAFAGCQKEKYSSNQKTLMGKDDMGVYNLETNQVLFAFDEETCQYAVGQSGEFVTRIQNDGQTRFINVVFLNGAPTIGDPVNVKINAFSVGGNVASNPSVSVNVLKIEDDKIWFEQSVSKTGYVMPWIVAKTE